MRKLTVLLTLLVLITLTGCEKNPVQHDPLESEFGSGLYVGTIAALVTMIAIDYSDKTKIVLGSVEAGIEAFISESLSTPDTLVAYFTDHKGEVSLWKVAIDYKSKHGIDGWFWPYYGHTWTNVTLLKREREFNK